MNIELVEELYRLGARKVAEVAVEDIVFDENFVTMCKQNACGQYGRNYGCPPFMGPPETLIADAKTYQKAYVFQTIGTLEDSYDFEGMVEAGNIHQDICRDIDAWCKQHLEITFKTLANGSCSICETCAARTNEPCRFPEQVLHSLDVYCIFVSELAKVAGMKYINGQDTVTYFGLVFVRE
ncbi:MAG: DUF2284 domain-containing protein [Eubacteriales bacterium]